jgi:hypothetical protein
MAVTLTGKGRATEAEVKGQRQDDVNLVALAFQPLDESSAEALLKEPS